jgi:hypothetical protein
VSKFSRPFEKPAVTEYILTYDGKPSYTVSIMEFGGGKVARETQYFAHPFEASAWRAQWVERMDTSRMRLRIPSEQTIKFHHLDGLRSLLSVRALGPNRDRVVAQCFADGVDVGRQAH